jgi:hypothetical protein
LNENSHPWRARVAWFVAIALALFLMQAGVERLNRSIQQNQTREEFAQLAQMLEKFRARHGTYPRVSSNPVLLQCLLGRADADGKPIKRDGWFLTGAKLFFRDLDPEKPGNQIVDPWGTPYVFRSFPGTGQWLLVSAGPDRRHSNSVLWPDLQNGTAPEDADNLWATSEVRRAK